MSSAAHVRLVDPNPLVTIQDSGRRGAMRYGVSESGPMDWVRCTLARRLAGDAPAAFEIGLSGARFRIEGCVRIAVAGPGFTVRYAGGTLTPPVRFTATDGEVDVVAGRTGMWAYLAVNGIDFGAPVLGSFATNGRTGLGSRDLAAGFACRSTETRAEVEAPVLFADPMASEGPVGLLPGPQHHLFGAAACERFETEPYRLTDAVDRMGYQLDGPPLEAERHDIISDGIVEGAVQVPGNGKPIVLLADRAPTGGYPKIAVLAAADRPLLAQRRPGETVHFRWIEPSEATTRRRALAAAIASPELRIRRDFDSEFLARQNLVGGVWPAANEPQS